MQATRLFSILFGCIPLLQYQFSGPADGAVDRMEGVFPSSHNAPPVLGPQVEQTRVEQTQECFKCGQFAEGQTELEGGSGPVLALWCAEAHAHSTAGGSPCWPPTSLRATEGGLNPQELPIL